MATPLNTTETSIERAAGASVSSQPTSVFDTMPDLAIYKARWQQRCTHYAVLRSYYKGTMYADHPELVKALKLYSGIRQIFGPLRRAVRVDVAKVPGGWTFAPDVRTTVREAVERVRAWSSYRATYAQAVQRGAVAGEFGLLVVDDWQNKTVEIVSLRPDEVVTGTLVNGEPFGLVVKSNLVDRAGRYEYAQLITNTNITTYRNGQVHDYGGGAERVNKLGFVPLLLAPYTTGEDGVGECAFAGASELLDRVNDAASQALDVIQRNAEPLTVFSGVDSVQFSPEDNAITLSKPDARAYTIAPNLVISEALALIDKVLAEFKNVLPQLIIDQLSTRNDLAYDTVVLLCGELIDHIRDVRTNVDAAIVQAERWALQAMHAMGVSDADPALHNLDADRLVIEPGPSTQLFLEQSGISLESSRRLLDAGAEGAGRRTAKG